MFLLKKLLDLGVEIDVSLENTLLLNAVTINPNSEAAWDHACLLSELIGVDQRLIQFAQICGGSSAEYFMAELAFRGVIPNQPNELSVGVQFCYKFASAE